jgi:hypothetical protein
MKPKIFFVFSVWMVLGLTACLPGLIGGPANQPVPTLDKNQMETAVVQTAGIRQTIAVLETRIGAITSVPSEAVTQAPSPTRTFTPTTTTTPTPLPTMTPLPATITNTPSIPCNAASFVDDITYPDGSVVAPGSTFIKTWRLKNVGSCGWGNTYALVFASGSQLGGPSSASVPVGVKPGETVDLSVTLTAPATAGDYTGYWQLKAPDGATFGTTSKSTPFWVKIKVGSTTMSGTSLIDNYCSAVWKNSGGTTLGCPAPRADFTNGSVFRVDNPKIEGGYQDNEPVLVMIPNNGSGGKVTGIFPAFTVQTGDHFISMLGCMDNTPKCSVTFKLSYTIDGTNVTDLYTWDHNFTGGSWQGVNVDLSSLNGQVVKFILSVSNRDDASADDQAFWMKPYVKR